MPEFIFAIVGLILALAGIAVGVSGIQDIRLAAGLFDLALLCGVVFSVWWWGAPTTGDLTRRLLVGLFAVGIVTLLAWNRVARRYAGDEAKRKAEVFSGRIESIFSPSNSRRLFEIGDSGTIFDFRGPAGASMFTFFDDSNLTIENSNGQVLVSTRIRDRSGRIVAELTRNEWAIARPPQSWDRNYSRDGLEVRDAFGDVVLQVRAVGDRAQIQGKWYDPTGQHGVIFVKSPN